MPADELRSGARSPEREVRSAPGPRRAPLRRRLGATELVISSFAVVIAFGTLLLALPISATGDRLGLVDALFIAVSATCVTGLSAIDIGTRLTVFGQLVVLACIQVGGLGLMTLTTVFGVLLGRRLGITDRAAIESSFDHSPRASMPALVKHVVLSTVVIEGAGAAALTLHWFRSGQLAIGSAVYEGVFHAVSAFCNAGFSLFSTNLVAYQRDPFTLVVISSLIVVGGLGFLVGLDVVQWARVLLAARGTRAQAGVRRARLSLHSRIVLVVSSALLAVGTVSYYLLERHGAFAGMSGAVALLNAYFCAVTPRTAGFNTVDFGAMGAGALLCTMVLMMVGASPGSTGGGIKTSTFGLLLAYALARVRGFSRVHLFGRTIPQESIDRAGAVVIVAISVVVIAASALLVTESRGLHAADAQGRFLPVLFETISAFGTVGLSLNFTPSLTPAGKLILCAVMFIGRVGPLTLALAVATRRSRAQFRYAEENLMIG